MSADEPVKVEVVQDGLVPWERALGLIKTVLVIVTCCAILYTLYIGYVALGDLQDGLQEISDQFGGLGG